MKKQHKHYKKKKTFQKPNERKHSNVLQRMIEMYEPEEEDWMGFKHSPSNPYTFHHIRERRAGGKVELENGAILTLQGHQFLNHLDSHNHAAYEAYQTIFKRINKARGPIDDDLREDIYGLMLDMFLYNEYHISKEELKYYDQFTDAKVKVKK